MKIQRRKRASWLIVFHIITRFTTSIECLRKIMKIVVEESWCKNLHHMLQKEYVLMLWDKTHIEFCVTYFGDLLLQLTSMRMMHSLMILKTYSKYHATKAYQKEKVWEWFSMSFQISLCKRHTSFNHSLKLENGTFQWWVLSRLH